MHFYKDADESARDLINDVMSTRLAVTVASLGCRRLGGVHMRTCVTGDRLRVCAKLASHVYMSRPQRQMN